MTEQEPIIRFVDVSKVYRLLAGDVVALGQSPSPSRPESFFDHGPVGLAIR